jgi:hypothetical protein
MTDDGLDAEIESIRRASADMLWEKAVLVERKRCAAIARSYDNPRGTIGNEMNALAVKIAEEIERGE